MLVAFVIYDVELVCMRDFTIFLSLGTVGLRRI